MISPTNSTLSKSLGHSTTISSDSPNSSIATRVDSFSTPYMSSKSTNTPNPEYRTNSPSTISTNEVLRKITSLGGFVERAKFFASRQKWDSALQQLLQIQSSSMRDIGYLEVSKTAVDLAAKEIKSKTQPLFHSPSTIKAYHFAGKIADAALRKEALDYINTTLPDDDIEPEESVTTEMSDILQDFERWDLAEQAALNDEWVTAYQHLNTIQDVFWKNSADGELKKIRDSQTKNRAIEAASVGDWKAAQEHLERIESNLYRDSANNALTKIAANAAIDVADNKTLYHTAMFKANGFCQDITDERYQENTGIILREMLRTKKKAPLGDISKFGNEWIHEAKSQHQRGSSFQERKF